MKKVVYITICLVLYLLISDVVYAEDGSLKINTDINNSQQSQQINYIEQEGELSSLFKAETNQLIQTKQANWKNQSKVEKDYVFVQKIPTYNATQPYTSLLFHTQTIGTSTNQHITINTSQQTISLPMIVVIMVAFVVMLYPIVVKGNKRKDRF